MHSLVIVPVDPDLIAPAQQPSGQIIFSTSTKTAARRAMYQFLRDWRRGWSTIDGHRTAVKVRENVYHLKHRASRQSVGWLCIRETHP